MTASASALCALVSITGERRWCWCRQKTGQNSLNNSNKNMYSDQIEVDGVAQQLTTHPFCIVGQVQSSNSGGGVFTRSR